MPESIIDRTRTPITSAADVRGLTGYTAARDVSDADLLLIIDRAQAAVIRDLTVWEEALRLEGRIDGANVRFRIPERDARGFKRPFRVIADDTLNEATTGTDFEVFERTDPTAPDEFASWAAATVASVDGSRGIITLTAAPAATVDAVEFRGRLLAKSIDKTDFKFMVELFAAHLCEQRVRESGKQLLANPNQGSKTTGPKDRNYLALYREESAKFKVLIPRSASVKTSMPNNARGDPVRESDFLFGG